MDAKVYEVQKKVKQGQPIETVVEEVLGLRVSGDGGKRGS